MDKSSWTSKNILLSATVAGLTMAGLVAAAGPDDNGVEITNVSVAPIDLRAGVRFNPRTSLQTIPGTNNSPDAPFPAAPDIPIEGLSNPPALNSARVSLSPVTVARSGGFRLNKPKLEREFELARGRMVTNQLAARGIPGAILAAIDQVPRQNFVSRLSVVQAYDDKPLDIGFDRTIESPYVVASVAEQLNPKASDRVLEIGTGSGYQTAVVSLLVKEVYSIETHEILARRAQVELQRIGYTNNVFLRTGEIAQGWLEAAPFDAIILNGTPDQITGALKDQLKAGGRLIIPVGADSNLQVMQKTGDQLVIVATKPVRPAPVDANKVDLPFADRKSAAPLYMPPAQQ